MKSIAFIFFLLCAGSSFAQQKETFDLVMYTIPAGWKKTSTTSNVVSLVITNNQKGTYCQIGVYASTTSKGSLQADFESEWQELIVKTYKPTTKPELIPAVSQNGWDAQGGVAPFEFSGAQSEAMLVTMSSHGRCMSIVILTNTKDYQAEIEKFLDSVDLKKIETPSQPVNNNSANNIDSPSILGIWTMTSSGQTAWRVNNGVMDYIKRQYTLYENGTYTFITKAYDPLMDKILLGKESGTLQISGNNLTIIPQKSVLEAWSKKDGRDQWGTMLNAQNVALEKVTYQFTKHYMSGIQEWNLVLQAGAPTKREGPFSNNSSFSNAYFYSPISAGHPIIELPVADKVSPAQQTVVQPVTKPIDQPVQQQTTTEEIKKDPAPKSAPSANGKFAFSSTNFDDGWISTVQEDWVQVVKGNVKVLIHYPNKSADAYNSVLMDGLKNAWNILAAPKYSTASNFEFKPISGWQSIEFAEADAVEKTTGKSVHVVLFKIHYSNGSGKYLEFITPDKKTYEQEFGPYHDMSYGWEKVEAMANYNKFAVAATDLTGKWTNDFSGALQYVNAYTGANAGMSTHASNESFEFMADNTYKWDLGVASGMVGNIKFQSVKSSGKFSLPGNWQIQFSDLEGKPRLYNAYFSCVKGARILSLQDTAYGDYSSYGRLD